MIRTLVVALIFLVPSAAAAQDWELAWSDEFETPGAPDPEKWAYDIGGHGWGNQEWQHYTDRLDNARVEDGVLIIEAREESYQGNDYTSARLVTRGRAAWLYGRIESRIKLPIGQGIWPAFWMLPTDSPYGGWPTGGEIDIMEYLGHIPNQVHGTLHYDSGTDNHIFTGDDYVLDSGTFAGDFHVFAIEWEPNEIRWYVNDDNYQTQIRWSSSAAPYPAPFDHPFHILLNVAVGGQWPGYPDETTTFPQRMEVDYVRIYEDVAEHPTVTLDGPVDGTTVESGGTLQLTATAADDGEIAEVAFLQSGGKLGVVTEPPYSMEIAGVEDGCYVISARATDDGGYETETPPSEVTVGAGCPDGSRWPFLMRPAVIPGVVEAEFFDLGGSGLAYIDLSATNDGSGIRQDEGVDIRPSSDEGGGHDVTDVVAREWLSYTVDIEQSGLYRILARAASGSGGNLRLSLDGEDLLGDVPISETGGDVTYGNSVLGVAELPGGRHDLRVEMRSAGFSLNRLTFQYQGSTSAERKAHEERLALSITPNPARGNAEVRYSLPSAAQREVVLYDLMGRRVSVIAEGTAAAGEHTLDLNLQGLAAGTYLCVLKTPAGVRTAPLVVSR